MKAHTSAALPWLVLPLALFLAGCQQDAAEEAEAASAAAAQAPAAGDATNAAANAAPEQNTAAVEPGRPLPGTDAVIVEDRATATAAAPSFDSKAFEGAYAAAGTTLKIAADGTFALTRDGKAIDGNWTLQPGGRRATLDPNSKGDADLEIDILSNDSVKVVGGATLARGTGTY